MFKDDSKMWKYKKNVYRRQIDIGFSRNDAALEHIFRGCMASCDILTISQALQTDNIWKESMFERVSGKIGSN